MMSQSFPGVNSAQKATYSVKCYSGTQTLGGIMHHRLWSIDYGSKFVFDVIRVIYDRGQESAFIVKMTADDVIINDHSKPDF